MDSNYSSFQRQPFINQKKSFRNYADIIRVQNDMNYNYETETSEIPILRINQFNFERPKHQLRRKKPRSCTDCGCLFIFILFICIWGGIIFYFLNHINIEQVIFPSDSYGHICGKGSFSDRPYLYFFNILKCVTDVEGTVIDGCNTPQICVQHCPNVTFSVREDNDARNIELKHAICQYGITPTKSNLYKLATKEQCAKYYFRSEPLGGRCIPSILHLINNKLLDEIRNQSVRDDSIDGSVTAQEIVESNQGMIKLIQALTLANHLANDLVRTWRWIIIGLIMTLIICFLWISFMQWIAHYMVWVSILALFTLNIFALYLCAEQYLSIIKQKENNTDLQMDSAMFNIVHSGEAYRFIRASYRESDILDFDFKGLLKDSLEPYLGNTKLWLIASIVLVVILFLMILIMLYLYNRVRLAIVVIEEASKAVNTIKSTLFFPIVSFFFKLLVLMFSLFAFITISTGSQLRYRNRMTDEICVPLTTNDLDCIKSRPFNRSFIYLSHAVNLFGTIWVFFFVIGLCYVTLAGVFADYYWTRDKNDISFFVLVNSFGRTIRYHLGSIAFGSSLIAIVRFIRIIFEYIENKCKKYPDNVVARFLMGCCKCCFWCLEKFLKFVNKNAYIMIAMHGKNFCSSAKDSFKLIITNGVRALVLNCLSSFLLFLSKLAVTCLSGIVAFLFITNRLDFAHFGEFNDLNYYWGPLGMFVILSYILASSFFNVYDIAVDTIFLCYLEDFNINDGSQERPYYMTKSLAKILAKRN